VDEVIFFSSRSEKSDVLDLEVSEYDLSFELKKSKAKKISSG